MIFFESGSSLLENIMILLPFNEWYVLCELKNLWLSLDDVSESTEFSAAASRISGFWS